MIKKIIKKTGVRSIRHPLCDPQIGGTVTSLTKCQLQTFPKNASLSVSVFEFFFFFFFVNVH